MRIGVLGAGSWGTAVAGLVAENNHELILWARRKTVADEINSRHKNSSYLPDYELPHQVRATDNLSEALEGVDALIFATPSLGIEELSIRLAQIRLPEHLPLCVLTKGIEARRGFTMTELAAFYLGSYDRFAVLSGPNHAEELSQGLPAASVCASQDLSCAEFFRSIFSRPYFRIYTSQDIKGVEICAAAKNVIALAAGIAAGYKLGDNAMALIMTRGLAEMSRLVYAWGGELQTCMGLAGMGDLIATCTSPNSRNRSFGLAFSQGESLEAFQNRRHMVVEGARASISLVQLAREKGIELPLAEAVYALLYEQASFEEIRTSLFNRRHTEEFYGLTRRGC